VSTELWPVHDAQRAAANRDAYRYAIASFNLLGVQAGTGNINYAFVDEAVAALAQSTPSAEVDLYRTRLDLLRKRITSEQAVERYRTIATAAGDAPFSWTGVSDNQRVDSYFDPFGNLSVRQRALLEAARELGGSTRMVEAEAIAGTIANELDPAKSRQFQAYFERYIRSGR